MDKNSIKCYNKVLFYNKTYNIIVIRTK